MSSKAKIGIGIAVIAVLIAVFATQGELLTGKITLQSCPGPYHVLTKDKRCVWSCGVGTTPDSPNNRRGQCICKSGYAETGKDSFGRRVCSATTTPPPPPPPPTEPPPPPPTEPPPPPPTEPPPPPPPPPSTGEMSTAHLSVEHDTVVNVRAGQVVAGTTNVVFGAFRFSADSESIRIRRIRLRNIGTNRDGLYDIRFVNTDGSVFGYTPWPSLTPEGTVLFDYGAPGGIITAGTINALTLKAHTLYSATSGSTVEFIIESIEGEGVDSGLPVAAGNISLTSDPTKLKRLYPTKLNFAWTATPSTVLITGFQNEVARFTLGADTANANNPRAQISVTALNFDELSTATLVNFSLAEVDGFAYAANTNSASFSGSFAGGSMEPIILEQGMTRTFAILADVEINAGSQVAQLRFNAGTWSTDGSATWSVNNSGVTSNSTWTVLAGNVPDLLSSVMIGTADTTGPEIDSILLAETYVGSTTYFDTGDSITIEFSERIDPITINSGLTYGRTVTGITAGSTGNITSAYNPVLSALNGTTSTYTVHNITTFNYRITADAGQSAVTATTVSLSLNRAGTVLTIAPTSITGGGIWSSYLDNAGGDAVLGAGTVLGGTIRDTAGNFIISGASPTPTGSM